MTTRSAALLGGAVGALAHTWRIELHGVEHLDGVRARGHRILFVPWHASLVPLVWHHRHRGITLLVSRHGDGGLLAGAAARWGYRLVRGSSTRGGTEGLRGLVRALASGDAAITPDGPRGPAGVVKPGAVAAARLAGAELLPVAADANRAWRLGSWDRLLIPAPGATVRIVYGPPLTIPRGTPDAVAGAALQHRLDALTRRAAA